MTCRLTIVIPSRSRADLLRRCLASVTRHAPTDSEVLVVDDASPGETITRAAAEFARVRVIRLSDRGGFCVAANVGIATSRSPFVELLNDDTQVTAGWADSALSRFDEPRVVAVAPLVLQAGVVATIDSAGDDYDLGGFARKRGHGRSVDAAAVAGREVFGASASSAFYRRDALNRVGTFPISFGAYFEDVDLSFRLRRLGTIVFEPASVVLHHGGQSYGRVNRRLVEQQSCNEERVFWRNLPREVLRQSLARHALVLAAKAARRWREGCLLPWFFGRLQAWREIPASRRHARDLDALGDLRPW
ncbi:MAG TPA: glycosyltransferase [Gemmataceae bacterium]|jgi:GT2 family glycosyltransferase|nr:glycosyltransferase [Gemmataceae bacterium]